MSTPPRVAHGTGRATIARRVGGRCGSSVLAGSTHPPDRRHGRRRGLSAIPETRAPAPPPPRRPLARRRRPRSRARPGPRSGARALQDATGSPASRESRSSPASGLKGTSLKVGERLEQGLTLALVARERLCQPPLALIAEPQVRDSSVFA